MKVSMIRNQLNWYCKWLVSLAVILTSGCFTMADEIVWQWSVPVGNARAYLWIPPDCQQVRSIVLANHNMIEQGILEHPTMRRALSELSMGQVWVVPNLDYVFDPAGDAGERFEKMINALAQESGYSELQHTPVVTLGHSANATWPWNFAAWNPDRTLAVLSIHGDAPQTNLTGYGRKNPDWGDRKIDGIPGLMVMGEYEWWEDRLTPLFKFKAKHPQAALAMLCDAGHGHFDFSDELVEFLAMFIGKAAQARLPLTPVSVDQVPVLRPVDPKAGYLVDRWHQDAPPTAPSAPHAHYTGDRTQAFWAFDNQMADAMEKYYARARGKKPQLLGIKQHDQVLAGEPCQPRFEPAGDGMTFSLTPCFLEQVSGKGGNPEKWSGLSKGTALGHPANGGPIRLSQIVGPVMQVGPTQFRLQFGRAQFTEDRRNRDIWLLASHPGDEQYKSAVQQIMLRVNPNKSGKPQTITFPEMADVPRGTKRVSLHAISDQDLPVQYCVVSGPAVVAADGKSLEITGIPPRARFPIPVLIQAWQWGVSTQPQVQTAEPVTQLFHITRSEHVN
tara:strand:+ start:21635 stop:23311 length:1677 start_codon:yes stop_codon:yes gene_type:complete